MAYQVDKKKCIGCGSCVAVCPNQAVKIGKDGKAEIDPKKCKECGRCAEICPVGAISKKEKN